MQPTGQTEVAPIEETTTDVVIPQDKVVEAEEENVYVGKRILHKRGPRDILKSIAELSFFEYTKVAPLYRKYVNRILEKEENKQLLENKSEQEKERIIGDVMTRSRKLAIETLLKHQTNAYVPDALKKITMSIMQDQRYAHLHNKMKDIAMTGDAYNQYEYIFNEFIRDIDIN